MKSFVYARVYESSNPQKLYIVSWDCDGVYVSLISKKEFDSLVDQHPSECRYCGTKLGDALDLIKSENKKGDGK